MEGELGVGRVKPGPPAPPPLGKFGRLLPSPGVLGRVIACPPMPRPPPPKPPPPPPPPGRPPPPCPPPPLNPPRALTAEGLMKKLISNPQATIACIVLNTF